MKNVKVSIIVPAYNTGDYLNKCMDSLICQTITDIEIIIIDDGSVPDLLTIIEQYGDRQNIIYIKNEYPMGPGAARNIGLDIALGEYITFCDSDDWVDLNLYENAVATMDNSNADIGIYSVLRERDGIEKGADYLCKFEQIHTLTSDIAIRILSGQYEMGIKLHNACWNKIFRKSFLKKHKAKFEEGIYFQGILFNVYTFLHAEKIICIPHVKYHHYRRPSSIVQSFSEKHIDDFRECYSRMKGYFTSQSKFEAHKLDYYRLCEDYMNIIVRQIFEFEYNEKQRKYYLKKLMKAFMLLIQMDDYFTYATSEEIRRHIQPHIIDTTLY